MRGIGVMAIAILSVCISLVGPAAADSPMEDSPGAAFRNCDGLGGASRSGDGILRPGRSVDALGRMQPSWEHSVAYCDRALANIEQNFPQYWQRRVSLLQSRAIHHLIAGDTSSAVTDLNAADAAVATPDDDYARTLGVNSKLIRAMALVLSGDREAGETLALEARAARPYSRAALLAALMVLAPHGERARIDVLMEELLRLDPRAETMQSDVAKGLGLPERNLHSFFMLMLDAESADRRGRGWEASIAMNANGCPREEAEGLLDGDTIRICSFALAQTPAATEEAILVRLARMAQQQSGVNVHIDRRVDVSHWAISPYSRVNDQSGYEIHIVATLTGPGDCDHCLSVDAIINDLGDRYPPSPPPQRR